MILGNAMTGVSLGLDTLTRSAARERVAIETRLALGHTRTEAFRTITRSTLRNAFIPIVNSMAAAGIVSLPGMMTGQILAGIDPVDAVKYQLMISFLIAGGTRAWRAGRGVGRGHAIDRFPPPPAPGPVDRPGVIRPAGSIRQVRCR